MALMVGLAIGISIGGALGVALLLLSLGKKGWAMFLGMVLLAGVALSYEAFAIEAIENTRDMHKGDCQEGLGTGTYQAQIVGTESHNGTDFYRLIVAGTDENNKDEPESRCRLVPTGAFYTPPKVDLEFQGVKVIKQGDFKIVVVLPLK